MKAVHKILSALFFGLMAFKVIAHGPPPLPIDPTITFNSFIILIFLLLFIFPLFIVLIKKKDGVKSAILGVVYYFAAIFALVGIPALALGDAAFFLLLSIFAFSPYILLIALAPLAYMIYTYIRQ